MASFELRMENVELSRKEKERLLRRDSILEAARVEFAEKGYGRAKLEDIAKRAEFGKGTLYNYFQGGKQGMLFAIFDKLFDDLEKLINKSFSTTDSGDFSFRENLYDYTVSCLSFYLKRRDLFLILVKEAHRMCFGENSEHAAYFRRQQERMVSALTIPIHHAMENEQLKPTNAQAVAHMILGNIQGLQVHMILSYDEAGAGSKSLSDSENAAKFLTTMLLDGLASQ